MANIENKTFCLIQITRFGDLIQTLQVAKALKAQRPDIRLVLVARDQFASPLSFLLEKTFDRIYKFDVKTELKKECSYKHLNTYFSKFVEEISEEKIDVSINFSFSKSSNYLHSLIESKYKLGPTQNRQNQIDIFDPWSSLVQSMVMRGPFNPFNIVDIYKKVIGVTPEATKKFELKKKDKITIHPFASHHKKSWPVKKWKEVIIKVLRANTDIEINLVGAPNEVEACKDLLNDPVIDHFKKRINNHVGKTNFEQLFNILKESSHFIGHDSMTGHLAKLAQLPTLTISLGTVRPAETTPYGHYSYSIAPKTKCFPCFPNEKCETLQCHADISYQATSQFINMFINNEEINAKTIKEQINVFHLNGLEILGSEYTNANLFQMKSLTEESVGPKSVMRTLLRILFLYKFSEIEENVAFPKINNETYNVIYGCLEGIQHLYELSEFGKKYSKDILIELAKDNPSLDLIKKLSAKIDEIDNLQALVLQPYPLLTPFVEYFQLAKGNLKGSNLVELSESNYVLFNDYSILTSTLHDLITKILSEHKLKNKPVTGQAKD
ncbi:MAG: glycosyltransferase family 9 protein [Oligoflexia bacterium]|nr:glycosyltransferase family 9 protein [Oligoflexia bacterium]